MKNNRILRFIFTIFLDLIFSCISGVLVGLYQYLMVYVLELSSYFYHTPSLNNVLVMVLSTLIFFPINYYLIKYSPSIDGSGVPYLLKDLTCDSRKVEYKYSLPSIYVNSYISSFYGLNLGSEGPSIVIGGKLGQFYQDISKEKNKQIISIYACSGFGCAFLSPLAGFSYFIEENFRNIKDFKIIIRAILVCSLSYYISSLINHHHLLSISSFYFDYSYIYIILFLILFNPLICMIFIKLIVKIKTYFTYHSNFLIKYRAIFLFLISILIGFTCNYLSGAGSKILSINYLSMPIYALLGILIYKIVFTSLYGAGSVTGGLVVPSMTLGAISSQIILNIVSKDFDINPNSYQLIILISMCMTFSLVNSNPITATILVLSTVFTFSNNIIDVLYILPVTLIANLSSLSISKAFNITNLYAKFNSI